MKKKYNRTSLKKESRKEIIMGNPYSSLEEWLDNYRLDFEAYYRNNQLKTEKFIENFLKNIPECQSCQRYKIASSIFSSDATCFMYDNKFCKIAGLDFFREEKDDERIILIKKSDEILGELKIKLDPILEMGRYF